MKPRFPLTTKILLLVLLNLALLVVVLAVFLRLQLRQEFESYLMTAARERITAVSRLLELELQETEPEGRDQVLERYSKAYGPAFLLFDSEGRRLAGPALDVPHEVKERLEQGRGMGRLMRPVPREVWRRFSSRFHPPPPFLVVSDSEPQYWVGMRLLLGRRSAPDREPATLLLASPTLLSNPFFFQVEPWLVVGAIALAVSLLCWLPLVRGLTKSVAQMMQATAKIAEGRFDVHVSSARKDELGRLGASINRMAAQLEAYVHGQKRFLGDVAHELRSPLGRMQVALGILERRADSQQRDYVADIEEDVDMMSQLTGELLAFAEAEMRPETLCMGPVNVAEAVEEVVRIEAGGDAEVRIDIDPGIRVLVERDYFLRSLANLIRNAVRYAAHAGPITVAARVEKGEVAISVADSGPGVPEEAIEKIFTPFYRLDESRDRRSGGTGLGLAIVKSCIEACRGSVECRNRKPSGLEVSIRLPAAS